jgi:hypothetical protein
MRSGKSYVLQGIILELKNKPPYTIRKFISCRNYITFEIINENNDNDCISMNDYINTIHTSQII